jgi:lysophospholipase L1-like esterase
MTYSKYKIRKTFILILLGMFFLFSIDFFSGKFFKTVNPLHAQWDKHLIRAFDLELGYRIRKEPFRSDLKFSSFKIKSNNKVYDLKGRLSFDNKEGNIRSAEGDYFLNDNGYRGPYFEKNKHKNLFRVVALGDSTTAGTHENELTYPRILERMLNRNLDDTRYQVLNAGVWGYTACQLNKIYKKEISGFHPDMLVLSIGWNDLQNGLLSKVGIKNNSQYCGQLNIFEKTNTFKLISFFYEKFQNSPSTKKTIYQKPIQNENLQFFIQNVKEIIEEAKKKNIEVGIFELPAMFELSQSAMEQLKYPQLLGWEPNELEFYKNVIPTINQALKSLADSYSNVFFIKSGISFQTPNKFLFFHDWVHPTGAGNRVLAYKVFQFISNRLNSRINMEQEISKKDYESYNQLELEYLKSLFVANQIEDMSYVTCVVLHGKCTHLEPKVKAIEYVTSVIEFSLGLLLQFQEETMNTPKLQRLVEYHLLKAIELQPDISLHYWVLGQVYMLKGQNQLALKYERNSIQINPLLNNISFNSLFNKFIKKHKPNPLVISVSNFIQKLSKGPNYHFQYLYFDRLELNDKRKFLSKKEKMDLIYNIYFINPLIFRSLFEYAILYLIEVKELNMALDLAQTLSEFKPQQKLIFKELEDRVSGLMNLEISDKKLYRE